MIESKSFGARLYKGVQYIYAIAIVIFCIFPFLWMLSTSLKVPSDVYAAPPVFITKSMTLQNYVTAIQENNLLLYFKNSFIIAVATVILTIIIGALAAYGMGYLELKGSAAINTLLVALQLLPGVISIVPLYIVCAQLNMLNTYSALVIPYLGTTVPVSIILLAGFFVDIPKELGEASMIDGCTTWTSFWKVILPVAIPGIVSSAIYTFIRIWQEFIMALSFTTKKNMYTLTIGLRAYEGANQTDWGGLMATAVVISVPAIILFILVQKQFVDSMSGSVKG